MVRIFFAVIAVLISTSCLALDVTSNSAASIQFVVLQDQFNFDFASIKNANVIMKNGMYSGLHIELKPEAAHTFSKMTQASVGKPIMIVINSKILTTTVMSEALTGNLLISGITKEEAERFINTLVALKAEEKKREPSSEQKEVNAMYKDSSDMSTVMQATTPKVHEVVVLAE